ncbi:uncharacterized protein STAUR_3923 [Stigmatella aurantiaca DW4/3-1]|nr:uncharacterized protein STAUR_3923 [Stigmatella aurantiaca DW4/3-1]
MGTMLWYDEWSAWSARLSAALDTLQLYARSGGIQETLGASNALLVPEFKELFSLLGDFNTRFGTHLPPGAGLALSRFFFAQTQSKRFLPEGNAIGLQGALLLGGLLSGVRSQVTYFLSDKQTRARRMVDRAFTHLQRSLAADKAVFGARWLAAFQGPRAEEACEKLGAVHLLQFGIWAFKAEAAGGKTDLILGERVNEEEAMRSADAMVLTEWKMVRAKDDPVTRAHEALEQAEKYTLETLAGFELSSYRYLVLVSEDYLAPIPPIPQGGRTYEVCNIAVTPSTPAPAAVAAVRRSGGGSAAP